LPRFDEKGTEMPGTLPLTEENVRAELEKTRPMLQGDGGDIRFVSLEDGTVKVELQGACSGCAFAALTLQHSVERNLRMVFPDLKKVENLAALR